MRTPSLPGLRSALAFAAVLSCLVPAVVRAASFTASLDRGTITLGESATLFLAFDGGGQGNQPPAPPAIPNLQIDYAGPSSEFSVINGQVSSKVTYNFTVAPRQSGDYVIPAMTVEVDGQKLTSQPLKLSVLKPGASPPGDANSESELALLKFVAPKKELFLGETMIAELQLYVNSRVQNFGSFRLTAMPADGFTVGKMLEGQRRHAQVGNAVYTVIPLGVALTPVKTGSLSIGPITASLVVDVPSTNRRRDSDWDPFGFLNRNEQRPVSLAADAETLQVLPLPGHDLPSNFNGAVGNYTMTVTASPTNVAVGDPITVRIQISGTGSLDALRLPDQAAWNNFKMYAASAPKLETSDSFGLRGAKTFEQVVVPQNADIKALPEFSFSYFDSERKSYQTLASSAIALAVHPAGAAAIPVVAAANGASRDNPPPSQDIVPIKQRLGEVADAGPLLVERPWFLGLQGVPVLALLSTAVWRRRSDWLANNPRLLRRRQVARLVRDGLNGLRSCAAENRPDDFFATLFRLLQEQLGERLDLPASAITEAVIEEHLRPHGVPESTLSALHELFQSCNLARYAPIQSSQELAAAIPKVEAILRDLQEVEL